MEFGICAYSSFRPNKATRPSWHKASNKSSLLSTSVSIHLTLFHLLVGYHEVYVVACSLCAESYERRNQTLWLTIQMLTAVTKIINHSLLATCCVTIQILTLNIWNYSVSSRLNCQSVVLRKGDQLKSITRSAYICARLQDKSVQRSLFWALKMIGSPTSQNQIPFSTFTYQSCVFLNIAEGSRQTSTSSFKQQTFSTYILRGEKESKTSVNNSNVDRYHWDK